MRPAPVAAGFPRCCPDNVSRAAEPGSAARRRSSEAEHHAARGTSLTNSRRCSSGPLDREEARRIRYRYRRRSDLAASRLNTMASNTIMVSFKVGIASGDPAMVVFAVPLLLPGVGSVTPAGGATVATFAIAPLTAAVPDSVSVTLPPLGSTGITNPACNCGTVGATGHTAPPVAVTQLTVSALKFATAGSVTTAPFAAAGPWLVTTSV